MVQHPTVGTIHVTGGLATCLGNLADELEQRFVHLREVADLRGPVVHLKIDIRGEFRIPRRKELVVPDALKIRRVGVARLRGGNQQVTAELEIGGDEVVVGAVRELTDALVDRDVGIAIFAQVERHTVIIVVIGLLMEGL